MATGLAAQDGMPGRLQSFDRRRGGGRGGSRLMRDRGICLGTGCWYRNFLESRLFAVVRVIVPTLDDAVRLQTISEASVFQLYTASSCF